MAELLKSSHVLYECSCKEMYPLYNLFFCRHCSALRCHMCIGEEIDAMFCPNCLESATVGEARLRKNRCSNCNQCPICETVLSSRSVVGETVFLVCSTCRWSTMESDIREQPTGTIWPVHEFTLEAELGKIMEKMRTLATMEKAHRDQAKSKSGHLMTDRFGLQAMYQKRKRAMEKPVPEIPVHEASEIMEEIDFDKINSGATAETLETQICQPVPRGMPLRPFKLPLKARKALRCKSCDHNVVKMEFAPCTLKYKVHYFARNSVPEVRLSREAAVVPGEPGTILLTVSNESDAKTDILLLPDPEVQGVECLTQIVELQLSPHDEAADLYDVQSATATGDDCVLFRRRHRAGIKLEIQCATAGECTLGLLMKFKNELCTTDTDKSSEWCLARLRIRLHI